MRRIDLAATLRYSSKDSLGNWLEAMFALDFATWPILAVLLVACAIVRCSVFESIAWDVCQRVSNTRDNPADFGG